MADYCGLNSKDPQKENYVDKLCKVLDVNRLTIAKV